jgi:hypothetical protein
MPGALSTDCAFSVLNGNCGHMYAFTTSESAVESVQLGSLSP